MSYAKESIGTEHSTNDTDQGGNDKSNLRRLLEAGQIAEEKRKSSFNSTLKSIIDSTQAIQLLTRMHQAKSD